MRFKKTYASIAAGLAACLAWWFVAKRQPSSIQLLKVADGFELERVAGPPLVDRPIVADFDEQGRLYVCDSSGSNDKVEKQLAEKPHRIVRLEDTNGDGRFDKSIVFADRMMFPEGALWYDGSLYVSAPPSIWRLTDTNGDGVADQREEWFQGKTLTNCANDLHGPYLGPDGWIYWCKGAFGEQTHAREGKPPLVTRASHIFRRKPGSAFAEPVMVGGMDNPVDVAFTPGGERILTATFLQQPEAGRRDGLIHAIYGGVYGKVNDVVNSHPQTGDLMPVMSHLGPAVPCGLTRYASHVFGDEYRDNFFACLFNLHKVTRHVLSPAGATFTSQDSDFLVSSDPDFHPTDVLEDADGSLVVIDTGAWYKLCCPTSQLAKPDVLGAIYRIRRKNGPRVEDPRGLKLDWASMKVVDLVKLLDEPRPAVRSRAIESLAKRGGDVVADLAATLGAPSSVEARRNAVWALTRIEGEAARKAVRQALKDPEETIRQAACHSVAVWCDSGALSRLLVMLKEGTPAVRRATAEALGRIGDKQAVPELLASEPKDRILEHSITYALIEIADAPGTARGLQAASSQTRRMALIALDQMGGQGLEAARVTPLLASTDPVLKETASWIAGHHPDWGPRLASFFRLRLEDKSLSSKDRDDLQHQLARFAKNGDIQALLASAAQGPGSQEARLSALCVMSKAPLKTMPDSWCMSLAQVMAEGDTDLVKQAVLAARAVPVPKEQTATVNAGLLRVGRDARVPQEARLDALAAVAGGIGTIEPELFDFLKASVKPSLSVAARGSAASALKKSSLSPQQRLSLVDSVREAGPLELPSLLACFEGASDEALGTKLLAALEQSKGLVSLRSEVLKPVLANFPASVQKKGESLLASLGDTTKQKAHLEKLLASLQGGDVRRGQTVFNGAKAACSSCHTIGYLGGKVGPDLTKVGQVRTERDLLEAIVYPSASFVRSYEPLVIATRSGDLHNGVVRQENDDEILLATGPREEVRIAQDDIKEMRPGTVSVMPAGLEEQLSRQELTDLLAFLKGTRWGAH